VGIVNAVVASNVVNEPEFAVPEPIALADTKVILDAVMYAPAVEKLASLISPLYELYRVSNTLFMLLAFDTAWA